MARTPFEGSPLELAKQSSEFRRVLKRFRKRVRELRQERGLSYIDIDRRSGVSWRAVRAIEAGEPTNPTLVTLTRLAETFGVEVQELLSPPQSGVRMKKPARRKPRKDAEVAPQNGAEVIDLSSRPKASGTKPAKKGADRT